MIVVTEASLSVMRLDLETRKEMVRTKITISELAKQNYGLHVQIVGKVLKPYNAYGVPETFEAEWDTDFKALMPPKETDYFNHFVIPNSKTDKEIWKIKYFRNLFTGKKSTDFEVAYDWLKNRDCVEITTKCNERLYKTISIAGISEKYFCMINGILRPYTMV